MTPKDVMSLQEASRYLAMDLATLNSLATERRIPCLEVDGAWLFSKKSIDKWKTQRDQRRA
ncbi:MAG: helix-turn-helix domain-containing protein [Candidatus Rokubacteria bacterium]|nr:helix-turn-helix domain-containing protein [Candidatus Rokubacteria bacterium]